MNTVLSHQQRTMRPEVWILTIRARSWCSTSTATLTTTRTSTASCRTGESRRTVLRVPWISLHRRLYYYLSALSPNDYCTCTLAGQIHSWISRMFGGVTCEIGCRIRGDGVTALDFFDGLIDEVRIFDRALSAVEVLETEAQHSWCARGDRGANYHYTSFEEPAAPDCACPPDPGLQGGCPAVTNQGACKNSYPTALQEAGRDCLSGEKKKPNP